MTLRTELARLAGELREIARCLDPSKDAALTDIATRLDGLLASCGEWLPIESAPRDGALYLAANGHGEQWTENAPPNCKAGRWHLIDGEWRGASERHDATHWRPLPTPPTTGEG